jgi:hypothetical protein
MKLADSMVGWVLVAMGIFHLSLTPRPLTVAALWFLSAGLFVIMLGAVNLLRIRYAQVAPGLRRVSLAANLAGIAVMLLFLMLDWHALLGPPGLLLLLLALATLFTLVGRAAATVRPQGAA